MAKKRGLLYKIRRKSQVFLYNITSPEFCSKVYCKVICGYIINIKNPKTFTEKMQWLKLYEWPNNPLVIQCADKYTVRSYLESLNLDSYLNELYGVWDNANKIDFNKLPNQFALKVTAGCGYNIICSDKHKLNINKTKKQLNNWLKEDFGKFNAEPHYSKMKSRIICEKFLGDNIIDYKYFIFNGKYRFMYVARGFGDGVNEKMTHFDEEGNVAPFQRICYSQMTDAALPDKHDEMKRLSEKIAGNFPFVRIDFFEVNRRIYFGEMTFTPGGGTFSVEPKEYDIKYGEILDISNEIKNRRKEVL